MGGEDPLDDSTDMVEIGDLLLADEGFIEAEMDGIEFNARKGLPHNRLFHHHLRLVEQDGPRIVLRQRAQRPGRELLFDLIIVDLGGPDTLRQWPAPRHHVDVETLVPRWAPPQAIVALA